MSNKRQPQLSFLGSEFIKPKDEFGGSLLKGNAKRKRPLDSKYPIHLTLRARKSCLRLPKTLFKVDELVRQTAHKYGVTIFKWSNVGNHLHLAVQVPTVRIWRRFIRELTGRLAQVVAALVDMGVTTEGFWLYKPHTRIIRSWKKAFCSVLEYIELNQLEAAGFIRRSEIKSLKELRELWADP